MESEVDEVEDVAGGGGHIIVGMGRASWEIY